MLTNCEEDLHGWLSRMAVEPLPGGVAAAAVAAAMGAALIGKATRVSVRRQSLSDAEHTLLADAVSLVHHQRAALVRLADADERAYRAVLDTRQEPIQSPARLQAWQTATQIPIQVAEACGLLLDRLPVLFKVCWPAVCVDLEIGRWLLETGRRAGLRAAETNLLAWGEVAEAQALKARLDALRQVGDH